MKQNKIEIPEEFKPARQHDENSPIFGCSKDLTLVSYVPKKNKFFEKWPILRPRIRN